MQPGNWNVNNDVSFQIKKNMKKFIILILLLTTGISVSGQTSKNISLHPKIEIYYFHPTRRCLTCLAIEANTKKTLDTYFENDLKSGLIVFQSVNVDEEINQKLAEKYEAAGSALWLTKIKNGSEKKTEMTNFAFSYGRTDPEKFINGLKEKINELLK